MCVCTVTVQTAHLGANWGLLMVFTGIGLEVGTGWQVTCITSNSGTLATKCGHDQGMGCALPFNVELIDAHCLL